MTILRLSRDRIIPTRETLLFRPIVPLCSTLSGVLSRYDSSVSTWKLYTPRTGEKDLRYSYHQILQEKIRCRNIICSRRTRYLRPHTNRYQPSCNRYNPAAYSDIRRDIWRSDRSYHVHEWGKIWKKRDWWIYRIHIPTRSNIDLQIGGFFFTF